MSVETAGARGLAVSLKQRLDLLEPLLEQPVSAPYVRDRLAQVAADVLRLLGMTWDMGRLEAGARADVDRDYAPLRMFFSGVAPLGQDAYVPPTSDVLTVVRKHASDALALLDATEGASASIDRMEVGLRLALGIDISIVRVIRHLKRPSSIVEALVAVADAKLSKLPEADLQRVWSRVSKEVDASESDVEAKSGNKLLLDPDVVRRDFFTATKGEPLSRLIARYLVDYRPRLVEAAARSGFQTTPWPPAQLATILTLKTPVELTQEEHQLIEHIKLLSYLLTKRLKIDHKDLALFVGVASDTRLLNGQQAKRPKSSSLMRSRVGS